MENNANQGKAFQNLLINQNAIDDLQELFEISIANKNIDTEQQIIGGISNGKWKIECSSLLASKATLYLDKIPVANLEVLSKEEGGNIYVDCEYATASKAICTAAEQATGRPVIDSLQEEYDKAIQLLAEGEDVCLYKRTFPDGTMAIRAGSLPEIEEAEQAFSYQIYMLTGAVQEDDGTVSLIPFASGYDDVAVGLVQAEAEEVMRNGLEPMINSEELMSVWHEEFAPMPTQKQVAPLHVDLFVHTKVAGHLVEIPFQNSANLSEITAHGSAYFDKAILYTERLVPKSNGKYAHIISYWKDPEQMGQKGYYDTKVFELSSKEASQTAGILIKNPTAQAVFQDGTVMKAEDFLKHIGYNRSAVVKQLEQDFKDNPIMYEAFVAFSSYDMSKENDVYEIPGAQEKILIHNGPDEHKALITSNPDGKKPIVLSVVKFNISSSGGFVPTQPIVYRADSENYGKLFADSMADAINRCNVYLHQQESTNIPVRASQNRSKGEQSR